MKPSARNIVEEVFNSATAGLLALFSLVAIVWLYQKSFDKGIVSLISYLVFGVCLFFLYLSSTLFHSLIFTRAKNVLNILDRSCIYLFIAATYTPFLLAQATLISFIILLVIWLISVAGLVLEAVFFGKTRYLSLGFFLSLSWISLILSFTNLLNVSSEARNFLLSGGFIYTLGVVFYLWKKLPFSHTIWHLFVSVASITHLIAVLSR